MANTILIKSKTDGAGAPAHGSGLKVAELAVNTSNTPATAAGRGNLFLGVTAESATNLAAGTNTAAAYAADQTGGIVWVGAPILDEDAMGSNDATKLATQQSIKAYVDAQITASDLDVASDSGSIDIALGSETFTVSGGSGIDTSASSTTLTIAGEDASTSNKGVASFDSSDFDVSSGAVSIKDNSITLAYMAGGTDGNLITYDTSGDPAFVATGNADQVLTSNGAGAAPTFQAAAGGLDVSGTDNRMVRMHGTDDLQDTGITIADTTDNVSGMGTLGCGAITSTGNVTSGGSFIIGSASMSETDLEKLDGITNGAGAANKALVLDGSADIASGLRNITLTGTLSDGNYTFDTSGNVSGLGTVGCGAITSSGNLAVTGTLTGDTSLTLDSTTLTTAELGVLDSVTAGTAAASKAVVLDGSKNIATIGTVGCGAITSTGASQMASLTVTGDLLVSGDTTTVNTATLAVEDPLIALATGNNAADAVDIGFYGLCDPTGSQDTYTGLIRDATDGEYHLFDLLQEVPTTTMNTSGTGFDHADLTVGALTVDDASTFTTGLTTGALTATANLDIGAYKFRCAGLMDDTLTSGRVTFATTNGELTDDGDMTFSGDTLTVTKIGAFEAAGAIDFSDENMTNVDIDSGNIAAVTMSGSHTWSAAQNFSTGTTTVATIDCNAGAIDGTTVGASSASTVVATTLTATTSNLGTLGSNVDHGNYNSTNVDIDSGAIDGTIIGAASAAAITCTTLNTGGKLTAGSNEIEGSNFDINGGTVDAITSLTVANSVDIGNYTLTANGLTIDGTFTDGTMSIVGGAVSSATINCGSYTAA